MRTQLFAIPKPIGFQEFIQQLKKGNLDVLALLHAKKANFREVPFQELLSNEEDLILGVNHIQKNFRDTYLGLFNATIIKNHDNGFLKYEFFTGAPDIEKIRDVIAILFIELGIGSFSKRKPLMGRTANSLDIKEATISFSPGEEITHIWQEEAFSISVHYTARPVREFSFTVLISPPKTIDYSIRKHTILKLVNIDIASLLDTEPIQTEESINNSVLEFNEYTYELKEKPLNVFDAICIRIYGTEKTYHQDVRTDITVFAKEKIPSNTRLEIAERFLRTFGGDQVAGDDLYQLEKKHLKQGFWMGRHWKFNQQHELYNDKNPEEKLIYSVAICDMFKYSFHVDILFYNQLIKHFGKS